MASPIRQTHDKPMWRSSPSLLLGSEVPDNCNTGEEYPAGGSGKFSAIKHRNFAQSTNSLFGTAHERSSEMHDLAQVKSSFLKRSVSQSSINQTSSCVGAAFQAPQTVSTKHTEYDLVPLVGNPTPSNQDEGFEGWLKKRSSGPIHSWQTRWFTLDPHRSKLSSSSSPANAARTRPDLPCAVLSYRSDSKGERLLHVVDVRREPALDADRGVAFSVGLLATPPPSGPAATLAGGLAGLAGATAGRGHRRVFLMAASDLEAVVVMACLRRILEPGRALPTLAEAMHFPVGALRRLE
jgi:hypothetical protein